MQSKIFFILFCTINPTKSKNREYERWYDWFAYNLEGLVLKFLMKRRTVKSYDFKLNLGFKLHALFNVEDQSVLKSAKDAFEEEHMAN